jgi:gliding motility-associated-like protein
MAEGSGALPQLPIFGTMGVSSPTNRPGGKTGANSWRDNNGNLWLFGGGNGSSWGDLWRYVPDYNCIGTCNTTTTTPPPPPPSDTLEFSVPNVFTPNGDNTNDIFEVIVIGYDSYSIEIYDRWGIRVFQSDDTSIHWNGTLQNTGSNCSSGTYYYIITLTDQSQVAIRTTGFLTLLR